MHRMLGYARISMSDQTVRSQVDGLQRAGCERIWTNTASGARADRPALEELLTRADAARIIAPLAGLAGAEIVGTEGAAAAALPEHTSGSDLREIVRRAVVADGDTGLVTTSGLLAKVGSGRYRATPTEGMYL